MKLQFTRKTWYALLLTAAAVTLLNAFFTLAGTSYSLLESISFCAVGMALLFLAAQKGAPGGEKGAYFFVFLVLLCSYMLSGWAGYVCAAAVWPMLLHVEYKRGRPVQRQLQLVGAAEALHLLLLLAVLYGNLTALRFWANLLWVLLACARGWAALTLYKEQKETV